MKKIFAFALTFAMLFSLGACGNSNGASSASPEGSSGTVSDPPSPPQASSASSTPPAGSQTTGNLSAVSASGSSSESSSPASGSQPAASESSSEPAPDVQPDTQTGTDGKILIAYFSKTGTTEGVAQQIQSLVGGDLIKIETVTPYPEDYTETTEIAKQEQTDHARPAISTSVENIAAYDTIFIGYPIWWGTAPMAVHTFLESYDFTGKTVIPFSTSGGSPIDGSISNIETICSGAAVLQGLNANDSDDIQPWLADIGML